MRPLFLILVCAGLGCGVKNDPVPPATPAEIGRGKPLYKFREGETENPSPIKQKDKSSDEINEK